jgi:hypothetical protein
MRSTSEEAVDDAASREAAGPPTQKEPRAGRASALARSAPAPGLALILLLLLMIFWDSGWRGLNFGRH